MKNKLLAIILGIVFFIIGLITLPHYGINWDTINHLPRGQSYLHYFLTGKKDFSDMDSYVSYWQDPDNLGISSNLERETVSKRSFYQSDATTFNYFMEKDGDGHPPLSDIISSFFNYLLFNKLKVVNDIDSYRVYGLFLSAFLIGLIYYWSSSVYGPLAGTVSVLSLSLYPLFWSESHFNTEKDIPETVFWSFMFFFIWKGVKDKRWKYILLSGVFFGLALGTKLNILFSIFSLFPWLLYVLWKEYRDLKKNNFFKFIKDKVWILKSSLLAFLIGLIIFISSWPYLWPDIVARIGKVIGFYKGIGLLSNGPMVVNLLAVKWILYTTPIIILVFFIFSLIGIFFHLKGEKKDLSLLFLFWFLVPVVRAVWPGTSIYGGVRQLMEYIPAMALLSGIGASYVYDLFFKFMKNKRIKKQKMIYLILVFFVPLLIKLIKIHPNENVYFNSLIGGLSGAKEKNLPYWGFSFGSPYRQAVSWINKNAEDGSNIVFTYDLIPNVPKIWLREDLNLHNSSRSGYLGLGEYAMGLIYQGTQDRSYYDSYLEKFVDPVYEVKVDEVPILKVWKNDKEHLKEEKNELVLKNVGVKKETWGLKFDLKKEMPVWRLEISYREDGLCKPLEFGYVQLSSDDQSWERLPGVLPNDWRISSLGEQPKNGYFIEPFLGQKVRYIGLVISPEDNCLFNVKNFKISVLEE